MRFWSRGLPGWTRDKPALQPSRPLAPLGLRPRFALLLRSKRGGSPRGRSGVIFSARPTLYSDRACLALCRQRWRYVLARIGVADTLLPLVAMCPLCQCAARSAAADASTANPTTTLPLKRAKNPLASSLIGSMLSGESGKSRGCLKAPVGPLPLWRLQASTALDDFAGAHAARTPLY